MATGYRHRLIEQEIRNAAKNFKVVLLLGARQVGKSTLLQNLFPDTPVVTFNPHEDVQGARRNPELFLSQFNGPVILDEIQFVPELLAYIKIKVDASSAKGQYLLTGSQNLGVLSAAAESLAGRVAIIDVGPMILHEIAQTFDMTLAGPSPKHWLEVYLNEPKDLYSLHAGIISTISLPQALWRGGLPGLLEVDDSSIGRYLDGYLRTYIDKDIRQLSEIEDLMQFEDFVALLAAISAQEINYHELGRGIAAAGKTAKRWIAILRACYVWRDVRAFTNNGIKRVIQKNKGYFFDTGFACYLLGIPSPNHVLGHPSFGALFETYIANAVHTIIGTLPFRVGMYHWRATGGAEVDIVLEYNRSLYPIEIKAASRLSGHDTRGIQAFYKAHESGPSRLMPGLIVYSGSVCYWIAENILAVPWNLVMRE